MAAAAAGGRERSVRDEVTLNAIHRETIRKENRCHRLVTEFTINPFHQIHVVTGKPMARHDNQSEIPDENFLKIFHHTALEPTKKYTEPQTTSQEIGWITQPLEVGAIKEHKFLYLPQNRRRRPPKPDPREAPMDPISLDRTDRRLHHHRHKTEITTYMEAAWRMREQSVNLQ